MKKIILLCALLIVGASLCFAQDDVYLDPNSSCLVSVNNIEYTGSLPDNSAGSILADIALILLDGTSVKNMAGSQDAVRAAIIKGLSDSFRAIPIDGKFTEDERNSPGSMVVDASVSNLSAVTKTHSNTYKDKNGKKHTSSYTDYYGKISLTLIVKDALTDVVIDTEKFDIEKSDDAFFESESGAFESALKRLAKRVRQYFDTILPLTGTIIENGRISGDRLREVYIDLGSNHRIKSDKKLSVYKFGNIAGKDVQKEIGKIRVKQVMGPEISLCRITSGAKDITQALVNGEPIAVMTYE